MIYADWNATTPPDPRVLEEMRERALDAWGNPSSVHAPGRAARKQLERARAAVGALSGFDPRDVILTSGGTEANNVAVRSLARHGTVITSAIEHPSVIRSVEELARAGHATVVAPVGEDGVVDVSAIEAALRGGPAAVSVQLVNHETGVVQPVGEIAGLCGAHGAPLHVDAVQGIGHLDRASFAGASAVTITAHKLRGPKGVGALALQKPLRAVSVLFGGAQERGIRPGTPDPIACAGFARAAELVEAERGARAALARGVAALRDRLEAALRERGAITNGGASRVPHVLNVSFAKRSGPELVAALDLEGVAVSSGAACTAGTTDPSPVIAAMVGAERARGALRFSLGYETTENDVDSIVAAVDRVLER